MTGTVERIGKKKKVKEARDLKLINEEETALLKKVFESLTELQAQNDRVIPSPEAIAKWFVKDPSAELDG